MYNNKDRKQPEINEQIFFKKLKREIKYSSLPAVGLEAMVSTHPPPPLPDGPSAQPALGLTWRADQTCIPEGWLGFSLLSISHCHHWTIKHQETPENPPDPRRAPPAWWCTSTPLLTLPPCGRIKLPDDKSCFTGLYWSYMPLVHGLGKPRAPTEESYPPVPETRTSNLVKTKSAGPANTNSVVWSLGDGERGQPLSSSLVPALMHC